MRVFFVLGPDQATLTAAPDDDAALRMQGYEKQTVPVHNHHDDYVEGEQQTYLRVAEIVLGKSLVPLNAREIVERGIEQPPRRRDRVTCIRKQGSVFLLVHVSNTPAAATINA